MRIWILTSEFPPQVGGGIGTYTRNAATMFSSAGHEVTVLTPSSRASDSLDAEGLRVLRFVPRRAHLDEYVPSGTPADEHPAFPYTCM
ncbi:MAG: hypothetical protein GTO63_00880, partial [Anaerolineae bacterium]|nr:hypothetical protein [Anaerolineae bacterium]NIN93585.1 hypothetical protein [Anaerolineae bacterium]NIQ76671.1 hypothetical protein [Anaerolineae bacterium]